MASSVTESERATCRTVILLRKSEKLELERLAAAQRITSAEVLRRLIREGETLFQDRQEQAAVEAALKIISAAVRQANDSMLSTMEKVDRLHREIMTRDVA